ncbi:MAG: hypothetical protein Q9193_003587 [Seirophora villosa]
MPSQSRQARAVANPNNAKNDHLSGDGERFDSSKIYIISVGQNNKEYAVHESVLRKSPVFAAMCEGQFKEAYERRILLPADNPQDIAAIVEYLYTNDFATIGNPNAGLDCQTCAAQLKSLYGTAEYYQMDPLKDLIVKKFKDCTTGSTPADWLAIAESIYPSLPTTDRVYPAYVRSLIIDRLDTSRETVMEELDPWTRKGGRLAIDINRACVAYWKQRGAAALLKFQDARSSHMHVHPNCGTCHIYRTEDWELFEFEDAYDTEDE